MVAAADPKVFRLSVGVLILIFSSALYLNKRPLAIKIGGRIADGAIGFAGGILGGLAGLSGPLPILWANIRGWNKHERRGIFQLFNFTVLATALWKGGTVPVVWTKPWGQGRVCWIALGHNPESCGDENFRTLLVRGTLWAATPPPEGA